MKPEHCAAVVRLFSTKDLDDLAPLDEVAKLELKGRLLFSQRFRGTSKVQ